MQSHHVVDAQHTRAGHMMAQAVDIVAIALLAHGLRLERGKPPILPFDE